MLERYLNNNRAIWIGFIGTVLLTLSFPWVAGQFGFVFIDALSDPTAVREEIARMTEQQRSIHAWSTATLDVAYPAAYGTWLAGSAYAFFGKWGKYAALPIFVLVPIDLIEGVVQVFALTDVVDWVDTKAYLTTAKFGLVQYGLLMVAIGWVLWVIQRIRGPRN